MIKKQIAEAVKTYYKNSQLQKMEQNQLMRFIREVNTKKESCKWRNLNIDYNSVDSVNLIPTNQTFCIVSLLHDRWINNLEMSSILVLFDPKKSTTVSPTIVFAAFIYYINRFSSNFERKLWKWHKRNFAKGSCFCRVIRPPTSAENKWNWTWHYVNFTLLKLNKLKGWKITKNETVAKVL